MSMIDPHLFRRICQSAKEEVQKNWPMRVLLIGDSLARSTLKRRLEQDGIAVEKAASAEEGDQSARAGAHNAIVLAQSPQVDGLALLSEWRRDGVTTPVLLLAQRVRLDEKVAGLNLGADDFLSTRAPLKEVLARLRAMIRRDRHVRGPVLRVCDLDINMRARSVTRAGRAIALTRKEFDVLLFLAMHRGQIMTRAMIWEHLYGKQREGSSNIIDVYIRYLRSKIDDGFEPPLILTHWGEGYLMRDETKS
jgi:DNA-binding response OmpR family regulator